MHDAEHVDNALVLQDFKQLLDLVRSIGIHSSV